MKRDCLFLVLVSKFPLRHWRGEECAYLCLLGVFPSNVGIKEQGKNMDYLQT